MQKTLKAAVAATLITPPIVFANVADTEAATVFSDVPTTQTHYTNIMQLYHENVINGYEDGTFRPNERVTRGQAAKILAGVLGLIKPEDTYTGPNPNFKDVPVTHSYYKYVAVLAQAGIINGYPDGTYRTGNTLTRGQMAKIIYNGFNLDKFPDVSLPFYDVDKNDQYYEQIKSLYALGVTVGKTEHAYAIGERVTRGQLASFVMRARHVEDKAIEVKVQNIVGTTMMTNKGTFKVAPSLQGVLNQDNVRALTGADVHVYASNNVVVGVQSIELNARGTEASPIALDGAGDLLQGDVIINSEYVQVRNMTIAGDVLVNGLNAGIRRTAKYVAFSKVTVTGTTTVKDDYGQVRAAVANTALSEEVEINVSNADLGVVSVERENTTFVTDTPLRYVTVGSNVSAFSLYGDITFLEARDGDIELKGTGTVTTFNYRGNGVAHISLRGRIGNLNITKDGGRVALGQYSWVEILAKLHDREVDDVLLDANESEYRVDNIIDYGKESNGLQSLEDLIVSTTRTDRTFYQGEALDITEFVVQGVYADGTLKRQRITAANITGYKPGTPGAQTLKITVDGVSAELKINVVAMSSLKIVTNPTKTVYRVGESLSTAGIVVEGTYANGVVRREIISATNATGFNSNVPGTQYVTIRVNNQTVSYPVRIIAADAPTIQSIAVTNAPTKVKYYQGEALSLSGLTVTGTYTDGTKRTETITLADVTGYDPMQPGNQTVNINVNGLRASFTVNVIEMTDLTLKTLPMQKEYKVNESLNTSGLQVVARFADNTERTISMYDAKITGFNSERPGTKNVRITYNGRAVSFQVDVLNVERIAVSKLPNNVTFFPGEALNLEGLEIQAQYSDQSTRTFPGSLATASGFNPNLVGDQVITLTYDGKTTQFKVRVLPLLSLKVEQPPTKTVYKEGEELDLTGLKVIGTYEGNRTREEEITKSMISGYDPTAHGTEQKVKITIGNIETTFDVTVSKSPLALKKLIIDKLPDRVRYRVGIPFKLDGLTLSGEYNDNTVQAIALTDPNLKITPVDTSKAGVQKLTIEYGTLKEEIDIDVYESALQSITASTTKNVYAKGEAFNPTTVLVKANFDDGTEDLTQGDYEVSGYDATKVGDQTITVKYRDKSTTFTVRVEENDVRSFTVDPNTVFITQGQQVDVTQLALHVTLDNAAAEKLVVQGTKEDVTISSFDNSKMGEYNVNVSYRGKTAPLKVHVVDAETIVSIDKVELWWNKGGVDAKYPYSIVSKADVDANNVYFKVLQAKNGAGKTITDAATLATIKINTVNFTKRDTTQADTTSAQVNATNGKLSVTNAIDLDVTFTYTVGGVPLSTPYKYALNMVAQRQATSAKLTSGNAVATTTSTSITAVARTITFDVLDQVGERFDLTMATPYYTLTKEGATEAATAQAVSTYTSGQGSIVTNIADAGTYTLRLYKTSAKGTKLGEFPLTVKKIAVPTAADQFDYTVSFDTSKETLDVANYAWANGYGASPTKTDELPVRIQAFVDGVEVAMPTGATSKMKTTTGMTLQGNIVKANNDVKPVSNRVVVMVGTKEVASSPDIKLVNTLPKYDAFTVRENVDIFKYFTASHTALMNKLRNGLSLTSTDKNTLTELVGKALVETWTISNEEAEQAIKEIEVISAPISSSADLSQKTMAINVTMHKMFTEAGVEKIVTVNGDYIEAWMNKAAATVKKADKTPATFTLSLDDVRIEEVAASTFEMERNEAITITKTPKPTEAVQNPSATTEGPTTAKQTIIGLTFNADYNNRSELESKLAAASGMTDMFTIMQVGNNLRFTLKDGIDLSTTNTVPSETETVTTKTDVTYIMKTNERSYTISNVSRSVEIPLAELLTAYKQPGKVTVGGHEFTFASQAAAPQFEQSESVPKFKDVASLVTLINYKLGSGANVKAEAVNGQLKLSTIEKGTAGNVFVTDGFVKVNEQAVLKERQEDDTTSFQTPWILGLDESYVGNVVLTFSQAVSLPMTNDVAAEDFIVNYTVGESTTTKQLKINKEDVKDSVTVSGTTVTVKLDGLANAQDFGDDQATIRIQSITGLKAVKGYYEQNVNDIYQKASITLQK